jgi:hypothetical protein
MHGSRPIRSYISTRSGYAASKRAIGLEGAVIRVLTVGTCGANTEFACGRIAAVALFGALNE